MLIVYVNYSSTNTSLCQEPPTFCHVERRATPVVETSHIFDKYIKNYKLTAFLLDLWDSSTSFVLLRMTKFEYFYQSLGQLFLLVRILLRKTSTPPHYGQSIFALRKRSANVPYSSGCTLCGFPLAVFGTACQGLNQFAQSKFTLPQPHCPTFRPFQRL